jgi:hypothetical protein
MLSSLYGHLDITRFLVESKGVVPNVYFCYCVMTPHLYVWLHWRARQTWRRRTGNAAARRQRVVIAVSKLTRCVAGMAKLPSKASSSATRATLQSICPALERQSDAAAAHRAHQSQTTPPKRVFPCRRINAVASSRCFACRTSLPHTP